MGNNRLKKLLIVADAALLFSLIMWLIVWCCQTELAEAAGVSCDCTCKEQLNRLEDDITELKHYVKRFETTELIIEITEITEDITEYGVPTVKYDVPKVSTSVKLFTDYHFYNLKYTPHYRLQQAAWTDENGLRRFNDDYIVALGSYYSTNIGDRFEVILDTGNIFTVILGDGKWDADCDERNMYTPCTDYDGKEVGNLLEFIVDSTVLDTRVYRLGDLNALQELKGNVVGITYLGRDSSDDWDSYETK